MSAKKILREIESINKNDYQYFRVLRYLMERRVANYGGMAHDLHMKYTKVIAYVDTLRQEGLVENTPGDRKGVDTIGINRIEHTMSSYVDEINLVVKDDFDKKLLAIIRHQLADPQIDYLYRTLNNSLKTRCRQIVDDIRGLNPPKIYFVSLVCLMNNPKMKLVDIKKNKMLAYIGLTNIHNVDLIRVMNILKAQYLLHPSSKVNINEPAKVYKRRVKNELHQIQSFAPGGRMPYADMKEIVAQQLFVEKH